jgi:hypothetical protein
VRKTLVDRTDIASGAFRKTGIYPLSLDAMVAQLPRTVQTVAPEVAAAGLPDETVEEDEEKDDSGEGSSTDTTIITITVTRGDQVTSKLVYHRGTLTTAEAAGIALRALPEKDKDDIKRSVIARIARLTSEFLDEYQAITKATHAARQKKQQSPPAHSPGGYWNTSQEHHERIQKDAEEAAKAKADAEAKRMAKKLAAAEKLRAREAKRAEREAKKAEKEAKLASAATTAANGPRKRPCRPTDEDQPTTTRQSYAPGSFGPPKTNNRRRLNPDDTAGPPEPT